MMPTVRIGRRDILGVIPLLLSFHPVDSIVVACLDGQRFGPVLRVDITGGAGPMRLAQDLAGVVSRNGGRCFLVFYGIDHDPMHLGDMLGTFGIDLIDTLFVPDNAQQELNTAMHAEYVGMGRVVVASREDLHTRVAFRVPADGVPDWELLTTMQDPLRRDAWMSEHIGEPKEALEQVLATCRRVQDPAEGSTHSALANLCAVAGLLAYHTREGALAQVCIDRALRADSKHRLARLMIQAIQVGIEPEQLAGVALESSP